MIAAYDAPFGLSALSRGGGASAVLPTLSGAELAATQLASRDGSCSAFYEAGTEGSAWILAVGEVAGGASSADAELARETLRRSGSGHPSSALTALGAALDGRCDWAASLARLEAGRRGRRVVTLASAGGHPPAVVLRGGGVAGRTGPTDVIELRPGDTLALMGTAVAEWLCGGDAAGLAALLADSQPRSAAGAISLLTGRLLGDDGPLERGIAAIALTLRGSASPAWPEGL